MAASDAARRSTPSAFSLRFGALVSAASMESEAARSAVADSTAFESTCNAGAESESPKPFPAAETREVAAAAAAIPECSAEAGLTTRGTFAAGGAARAGAFVDELTAEIAAATRAARVAARRDPRESPCITARTDATQLCVVENPGAP